MGSRNASESVPSAFIVASRALDAAENAALAASLTAPTRSNAPRAFALHRAKRAMFRRERVARVRVETLQRGTERRLALGRETKRRTRAGKIRTGTAGGAGGCLPEDVVPSAEDVVPSAVVVPSSATPRYSSRKRRAKAPSARRLCANASESRSCLSAANETTHLCTGPALGRIPTRCASERSRNLSRRCAGVGVSVSAASPEAAARTAASAAVADGACALASGQTNRGRASASAGANPGRRDGAWRRSRARLGRRRL